MSKRAAGAFPRNPRGLYLTPLAAVQPLRPFLRPDMRVWEPCAADGGLCVHLQRYLQVILATDIEPLGDASVHRFDALTITSAMVRASNATHFITNPPWPEPRANGEPAVGIIRHLARMLPTWMLLPADFMHNAYAGRLLLSCDRIVSVGRVKWITGSRGVGYDNCCWYEFDMRDNKVPRLYGTTFHGRYSAAMPR